MREDMIALRARENRRAQVLTLVLEGAITLKEAAVVMDVSVRQARRLKGNLRRAGPGGLVHGNRGRASPRRTDPATENAVVAHYRGRYAGTNAQHFTELLAEREGIDLSVATVRRKLKAAGVLAPKTRRVAKHRSRRERMPAEGMLVQMDGSPFRWLGPDGPEWCLLGAIDDATGDPVGAIFHEQEDAAGYMEILRQVVTEKGIPAAVYRDRHMIFEVSKRVRSTLEEDFAGSRFPTQVGRLLIELGVESIAAYSPQAKGRVERSWRTQQDRLVSELRLAGIETMEEANAFLPGYLERYRARFAVAPRSAESAYVPIDPTTDLDRLFCFKYPRKVAADNTVHFSGQVIQIPPGPDRLSYAHASVEVHERLNGSIAVFSQGQQLVVLPPSSVPPVLRSRGHQFAAPKAPARPIERPLSWEEVRRRARAASPTPPMVENGRPTHQHPWQRAAAASAGRVRERSPLPHVPKDVP
jgi:transposase